MSLISLIITYRTKTCVKVVNNWFVTSMFHPTTQVDTFIFTQRSQYVNCLGLKWLYNLYFLPYTTGLAATKIVRTRLWVYEIRWAMSCVSKEITNIQYSSEGTELERGGELGSSSDYSSGLNGLFHLKHGNSYQHAFLHWTNKVKLLITAVSLCGNSLVPPKGNPPYSFKPQGYGLDSYWS